MAIDRSKVSALLQTGLRKVWFEQYNLESDKLSQLFNKSASKKAWEEWTGLTSIGTAEEKAEGVGVIFKDPSMLPTKRLVHVTYGLGLRATMEAIQDEQYGILKKLAALIGRGFKIREQVDMANALFNYAFNSTHGYTGYDGLCRFSASHTLSTQNAYTPATTNITTTAKTRDASTCSNLLTAADLSYTSLQDAVSKLRRQVDDAGDWIVYEPRSLWIAPENYELAKEILKSTDRPDTANRSISSLREYNISIVSSPYFLDTDAWVLSDDTPKTDLQWFDRMALETQTEDDFATGDMLMRGFRRYSMGFSDWRGAVGNTGA